MDRSDKLELLEDLADFNEGQTGVLINHFPGIAPEIVDKIEDSSSTSTVSTLGNEGLSAWSGNKYLGETLSALANLGLAERVTSRVYDVGDVDPDALRFLKSACVEANLMDDDVSGRWDRVADRLDLIDLES